MNITTLCFPVTEQTIWLAIKKRKIGAGLYFTWGGKVEGGEDIAIATVREFHEESTAHAVTSSMHKVAIIDFFEEDVHLYECHIFFLTKWEGEMRETDEMGQPEEFFRDSIPFNKMMKGDKFWLPMLCLGKKIRGTMRYKKGMKEVYPFEWVPLSL